MLDFVSCYFAYVFLAILIWSARGWILKILAELLCPLKAHAAFAMGSACVFMLMDIKCHPY